MSPLTLPDYIIPEILCRLPVKDLLRYRNVSKLWRSLIDSPDFINLHLTYSHRSRGAVVAAEDRHLYWINLRSPGSATKLPNPIADVDRRTEVIGSCNGLVVLENFSADSDGDVAIWNPATRQYQRVPIPGLGIRGDGRVAYPTSSALIGFGHDPVNDEYKLVRLLAFLNTHGEDWEESVFMLYSMKAKMWKRSEGQSFTGFAWNGHALVCNAIHWIVVPYYLDDTKFGSIFAFDIRAERFHEVPQPDHSASEHMKMLVELRGCLCLLCYYDNCDRQVVWMMKEYGVRESWTKLLSVGPTEMGGPFTYVYPVAFDDRVLLSKDGEVLVVYDLRNKRTEIGRISGVNCYEDLCPCEESLVRLDWDVGESVKDKLKQSGKKRDDFLSEGFKLKL